MNAPTGQHVAPRTRISNPGGYDVQILLPVFVLVGLGLVMVYSSSSALAVKRFGSEFYFVKRQAVSAVVGFLGLLVCRVVPLSLVRRMAYPLLGVSLALLVAVLLTSAGVAAGGAQRWLKLGPTSVQPAEIARVAMLVYLAYSLEKKAARMGEFSIGLLPHLLIMGVFAALILAQPDFGSSFMLMAMGWVMLLLGGASIRQMIAVTIPMMGVAWLLLSGSDYRMRRIVSFLDPWRYASREGYQVIHSLMAFGSGGLTGVGLGNGVQKLFYLPEPHTDFIFSVIGEEIGIVGGFSVLLLYVTIVWQGFRIAMSADTDFKALLAAGLTFSLGFQVVVNVGVTMSLLPTKGLPLPFISYGGSSLVMSLAAIGLLMNIGASPPHETTP